MSEIKPVGICLNEPRKGRVMAEMCRDCDVKNCRWRMVVEATP